MASIGYRVSRADYSCKVHSVFAHACNFEHLETLLTLVVPGASDGPTTLVLHRNPPCDLRKLFSIGEVVACRDGIVSARRAALLLDDARVWRPHPRRPLLPRHSIAANLRLAAERLALCRLTRSSRIDSGEGAATTALLAQARRRFDRDTAARCVYRLIGWGEGLTPAGDDFLVGHIAGLAWLAQGDDQKRLFLDDLCRCIVAALPRTTPIAAHLLRLAAQGHFEASIDDLRDALLCEDRRERVSVAIDRALGQGATSGADMVSGLLSALLAWSPVALDV